MTLHHDTGSSNNAALTAWMQSGGARAAAANAPCHSDAAIESANPTPGTPGIPTVFGPMCIGSDDDLLETPTRSPFKTFPVCFGSHDDALEAGPGPSNTVVGAFCINSDADALEASPRPVTTHEVSFYCTGSHDDALEALQAGPTALYTCNPGCIGQEDDRLDATQFAGPPATFRLCPHIDDDALEASSSPRPQTAMGRPYGPFCIGSDDDALEAGQAHPAFSLGRCRSTATCF